MLLQAHAFSTQSKPTSAVNNEKKRRSFREVPFTFQYLCVLKDLRQMGTDSRHESVVEVKSEPRVLRRNNAFGTARPLEPPLCRSSLDLTFTIVSVKRDRSFTISSHTAVATHFVRYPKTEREQPPSLLGSNGYPPPTAILLKG